eukprot:GFKZ01001173.1.p1 GENE.GFKZ01001173.1~~GFKZ01001173.1.p1  ORF type:complete len:375 (+),score=35.69 GFKZ01001173.1:69-1127(+)
MPMPPPPPLLPPQPTAPARSSFSLPLISTLQPAAVHRVHTKPISTLDFSSDGALLATAAPDHSVSLYNPLHGTHTVSFPVLKHGVSNLRFLPQHSPPTLLTSSSSPLPSPPMSLLDLATQSYLRFFNPPPNPAATHITSLAPSPISPTFLSARSDASVHMWDLRVPTPFARLRASAVPLVSYDPKGLIFSLAYNHPTSQTTLVKLYDPRQYHDGPFLEFQLGNPTRAIPTSLQFSSDGEYFLLVNADVDASVHIYDAYKGEPFRVFRGHRNVSGIPLDACFSPDSAFLATGSDDGSVKVWHVASERLVLDYQQIHALPSTCVRWNPLYHMMATACQNVMFWLPRVNDAHPDY